MELVIRFFFIYGIEDYIDGNLSNKLRVKQNLSKFFQTEFYWNIKKSSLSFEILNFAVYLKILVED